LEFWISNESQHKYLTPHLVFVWNHIIIRTQAQIKQHIWSHCTNINTANGNDFHLRYYSNIINRSIVCDFLNTLLSFWLQQLKLQLERSKCMDIRFGRGFTIELAVSCCNMLEKRCDFGIIPYEFFFWKDKRTPFRKFFIVTGTSDAHASSPSESDRNYCTIMHTITLLMQSTCAMILFYSTRNEERNVISP
jgi:hypothetical protein